MSESQGLSHPEVGYWEASFLEDLAVLCDGPSIDLHFTFDGIVLALKSRGRALFGKSAERVWQRLDAKGRGRLLVRWLREAAETYRKKRNVPLPMPIPTPDHGPHEDYTEEAA